MKPGLFKNYAYGWLTVGFFLGSLALHWVFGWYAYRDESREHGQRPRASEYVVEMGRDTFENWQSEFLQLLWQVIGLAYFLYLGSPASKENDDRLEAKVDALLRLVGRDQGERLIADPTGDTSAPMDTPSRMGMTGGRREGHRSISRRTHRRQDGDAAFARTCGHLCLGRPTTGTRLKRIRTCKRETE